MIFPWSQASSRAIKIPEHVLFKAPRGTNCIRALLRTTMLASTWGVFSSLTHAQGGGVCLHACLVCCFQEGVAHQSSTTKQGKKMKPSKLGLMVVIVVVWVGLARSVGAVPAATGHFLEWAAGRYGPSKWLGEDLVKNLVVITAAANNNNWQPRRAFQNNLPPWQPHFGMGLDKLHIVGGAMGTPGTTSFHASPSPFILQALGHIAQILQPALKDALGSATGGTSMATLFQLVFRWDRAHGHADTINEDICMPYQKAKLSRKRKKAGHVHPNVFLSSDGYLKVLCGYTHARKEVVEYAHRLVCIGFNGPPPDAAHNVVSHMCNHKWCLNPRHMRWSSIGQNLAHPQQYPPIHP